MSRFFRTGIQQAGLSIIEVIFFMSAIAVSTRLVYPLMKGQVHINQTLQRVDQQRLALAMAQLVEKELREANPDSFAKAGTGTLCSHTLWGDLDAKGSGTNTVCFDKVTYSTTDSTLAPVVKQQVQFQYDPTTKMLTEDFTDPQNQTHILHRLLLRNVEPDLVPGSTTPYPIFQSDSDYSHIIVIHFRYQVSDTEWFSVVRRVTILS